MYLNKSLALLFIIALAGAVLGPALGAPEGNDPNAAKNYCIAQGNLYRAVPTDQGMQERCVFEDKSYCEAWSYYRGYCGQSRSFYSVSSDSQPFYYYSDPFYTQDAADVRCMNSGGSLEVLHNPSGDQVVCLFPDGTYCDKWSFYYGNCRRGYHEMPWLSPP